MQSSTLTDLLTSVQQESAALRSDVHNAEAARRKANRLNTFLLGFAVVLVVAVLVVGWQNNRLTNQVNETNAKIADCTTAGRACYEQGRERTGDAISAVVRISILVSQCGRLYPGESGPDYDKKLEACVLERLGSSATPPATTAPR
jgi:hypothetical protein